jgi:uncharacterized protein
MPLFAIAAADIDAAGRSLEADLPVAWLDAELAECDARASAPGHLSARLSRSGGEVVVRGHAHVVLEVACARCLDPAKLDIDADLSLLLKPVPGAAVEARIEAKRAEGKASKAAKAAKEAGGKAPSKAETGSDKGAAGKRAGKGKEKELPEYEFSSDEADLDVYDGETVVLDGFVRETILLEMPIFPLCSEACPGIRPASPEVVDGGVAPTLDPRLAPLRALRVGLAGSASGPRGSGESTEDQGAVTGKAGAPHEKKTKKE